MMNTPLPIGTLRVDDILLLLVIGASAETAKRFITNRAKSRSGPERALRSELHQLRYRTARSRNLGPGAFVETSKLERAVLAKEKKLAKIEGERTSRVESLVHTARNINLTLNLIVFALYYGIPMMSVDGTRVQLSNVSDAEKIISEEEAAASFAKGLFFPLSYIGFGLRLAGMGLSQRASSLGALVVMWSAQSTIGKISDCLEAFQSG
eukprot:CAMPEP_0183307514 /NCGR_PEP_ID=MMETSP0160_2-20130417/17756_1 /TAXON_ID=2839 ORGANISM="Odontella Sinensis, Strain Grunow 1884" /NCGR_SAMPLE_ID=MMETSP0160_2 /ASSEMBLY_ACC=CAM_ASM_000250 /LENGTH=208 /DNA_ID=CAMNT_0025471115 /DNA_START=80 /DNA_END=706 /DNA_ORIENTATION=+